MFNAASVATGPVVLSHQHRVASTWACLTVKFAINNAWHRFTDSAPLLFELQELHKSPINVVVVSKMQATDAGSGSADDAGSEESLLYAHQRIQKTCNARHRALSKWKSLHSCPRNLKLVAVWPSFTLLHHLHLQLSSCSPTFVVPVALCLQLLHASVSSVHHVLHGFVLRRVRCGIWQHGRTLVTGTSNQRLAISRLTMSLVPAYMQLEGDSFIHSLTFEALQLNIS